MGTIFLVIREYGSTLYVVSRAPDSFGKESGNFSHVSVCSVGMLTPQYDWSSHMIARLIGERAKRARHSQVCSIENRGYIYIQ